MIGFECEVEICEYNFIGNCNIIADMVPDYETCKYRRVYEKSIPKKPIVRTCDEIFHRCPTCKNYSIEDIESLFDYCVICGQAIDWSEQWKGE